MSASQVVLPENERTVSRKKDLLVNPLGLVFIFNPPHPLPLFRRRRRHCTCACLRSSSTWACVGWSARERECVMKHLCNHRHLFTLSRSLWHVVHALAALSVAWTSITERLSSVGFEPAIVGTKLFEILLNERTIASCRCSFSSRETNWRKSSNVKLTRLLKTLRDIFTILNSTVLLLLCFGRVFWGPQGLPIEELFLSRRCQLRWKLLQNWQTSNPKLKPKIFVRTMLPSLPTLWTLPCPLNTRNNHNSNSSSSNNNIISPN